MSSELVPLLLEGLKSLNNERIQPLIPGWRSLLEHSQTGAKVEIHRRIIFETWVKGDVYDFLYDAFAVSQPKGYPLRAKMTTTFHNSFDRLTPLDAQVTFVMPLIASIMYAPDTITLPFLASLARLLDRLLQP